MRVVTTNCDSRVPLSTQLAMWCMYDNTGAEERDYFHVFESERTRSTVLNSYGNNL